MRSPIYRSLLALAVMIASLHASGFAAVQNRIAGNVQEVQRASLTHTVAPRAARAADLGAAPSSLPLQNMTMRFSMTDAQQAALSQLLINQQNPSSPHYHQWLTPQKFGAQFGLSAADLAKVSSWLTTQGFTVTGTAKSSTFIVFSGTAAQVQQAFGTTIHNLSLNGERHIANLTEPTLPASIASVVSNISGLNDFRLKPQAHTRRVSIEAIDPLVSHPKDSINTTAGLQHYISPGDFYTIYNLNPLLTASPAINGAGITIAVMGQVNITPYLSDVAAFRAASGLSARAPTVTTYGTDPGTPTGTCLNSNAPSSCSVTGNDLDESELDVEWAGATAPSANIVFVNSTNVIEGSLVNAIDNNLAPIMTVSYGGCEVQNFSASSISSLNLFFAQANAEGITIVGPSGDSGATDCDPTSNATSATTATHGLAVDFPASSPNVTGVGGTEFSEGADTSTPMGSYWNNSTGSSASVSSALSYIPEMVWNDTAAEIASNPSAAQLSAGGGGASVIFSKPSWQTGTGVPADRQRDVPDVAFAASANHDAYLVCAQGSCPSSGNVYFAPGASIIAYGGTSVSTPSFAGILALVEQKLGGSRIGNANPYIYALANSGSYSSVFHDVTTGDNKSPCTSGSTGCPSGTTSIGFSAGIGYDQTTGWGSIDATQFANSFSSVAGALPNSTTTTVTYSPSTPSLNQTVTFTATVGHSSGLTVPTGTVVFTVDNTSPVSETVNSSGIATYSTTFTSNGTHTIYAVYSGDPSNYYGSSSTTTLVAGTVPTGSFTLSAFPAAITVANAGAISSTITIKSTGVYAGTVNLTAVAPTLNGSYSFVATSSSPTCNTTTATITLAAGASGTCTFTVSSVTPTAKGGSGFKQRGGSSSLLVGGAAALAGLFFFGFSGIRQKRWPSVLSLFALAALITSVGCGSSSSTVASTTTASGPYTVTITGTDSLTSAITASTTLTVTLK